MIVELKKYGPIISDKEIGSEIHHIISKSLEKGEILEVDFTNIISMATYCAKQVFGRLYIELGAVKFFENIKFQNVNDDLKIIIKMGIQSAIEEDTSNNN